MQFSATYKFRKTPQAVWDALMNPNTIGQCIPGCERIVPDGPDRYRVSGSVGVAFLRKQYQATVEFTELDPPRFCRIIITNAGGRPAHTVTALVTLEPADAGTILEAKATGTGLTGGIAQAASDRMIRQFFDRLSDHA